MSLQGNVQRNEGEYRKQHNKGESADYKLTPSTANQQTKMEMYNRNVQPLPHFGWQPNDDRPSSDNFGACGYSSPKKFSEDYKMRDESEEEDDIKKEKKNIQEREDFEYALTISLSLADGEKHTTAESVQGLAGGMTRAAIEEEYRPEMNTLGARPRSGWHSDFNHQSVNEEDDEFDSHSGKHHWKKDNDVDFKTENKMEEEGHGGEGKTSMKIKMQEQEDLDLALAMSLSVSGNRKLKYIRQPIVCNIDCYGYHKNNSYI